ncbi:MAG: hypothetical protein RL230_2211, partial [Pseudomonadota bacterium]
TPQQLRDLGLRVVADDKKANS